MYINVKGNWSLSLQFSAVVPRGARGPFKRSRALTGPEVEAAAPAEDPWRRHRRVPKDPGATAGGSGSRPPRSQGLPKRRVRPLPAFPPRRRYPGTRLRCCGPGAARPWCGCTSSAAARASFCWRRRAALAWPSWRRSPPASTTGGWRCSACAQVPRGVGTAAGAARAVGTRRALVLLLRPLTSMLLQGPAKCSDGTSSAPARVWGYTGHHQRALHAVEPVTCLN